MIANPWTTTVVASLRRSILLALLGIVLGRWIASLAKTER